MPLPYIIPAAMAGAKTLFTLFNKPKKQEPTEMLNTLDRQISNQQSDIVNKTLMNTITSGAKSLGSRMYQQQEHGLDIMRSRGDLSEGQHAQGLLSAGAGVQEQVGQQQEGAILRQQEANLGMQDRINNARLQYAGLKDQARMQYESDKSQWKNELAGGILDTATVGFNSYMQKLGDDNVKEAVSGFLNGKNIADLDDTGLQGLLATLLMARTGYKATGKAIEETATPEELEKIKWMIRQRQIDAGGA